MASLLAAAVGPVVAWTVGLIALAVSAVAVQVLVKRWRRSRFAEYGFQVKTFQLEQDGTVQSSAALKTTY